MIRKLVFTALIGTILAIAATAHVPTVDAKTLGMVVAGPNFFSSPPRGSVTVFDADTNQVLGTVNIPAETWVGDVVITSDQTRGFVASFDTPFVYVIDLTTSP